MSQTPTEPPTAGFQHPAWTGPGYQQAGGGWPPQPPPGQPPKKKHRVRKVVLWSLAAFVVFIVLISVIVAVAGGNSGKTTPIAAPSTHAAAKTSAPATTAPAAVQPSPDGTFQGNCDYTLGSDPANGTAVATGDIQTTNTGNIGIVVKLKITWPQEGFAPLSQTKTVRVPAGGSQDVQFNRPISSTEVDNLQNYQLGHSDTGCTYHGTIESTFGKAH